MAEPQGDSETQPAAAQEPADSKIRLGLETNLLIWVRTGLALMGFGFVLARFGLFLYQLEEFSQVTPRQIRLSLTSGIAMIFLGVVINLAAAVMHYPYLARARRGETDLPSTWWLALGLSVILAVLGVGMAVMLLIMAA
jgi:putative membrane protein